MQKKIFSTNSLTDYGTHGYTCYQLKLILAKRTQARDGSPVINACKTEPEMQVIIKRSDEGYELAQQIVSYHILDDFKPFLWYEY